MSSLPAANLMNSEFQALFASRSFAAIDEIGFGIARSPPPPVRGVDATPAADGELRDRRLHHASTAKTYLAFR